METIKWNEHEISFSYDDDGDVCVEIYFNKGNVFSASIGRHNAPNHYVNYAMMENGETDSGYFVI